MSDLPLGVRIAIQLMRFTARRRCWHCRTAHDGELLRNRQGLMYCADRDACTARRHARGWNDDLADRRVRITLGEAAW